MRAQVIEVENETEIEIPLRRRHRKSPPIVTVIDEHGHVVVADVTDHARKVTVTWAAPFTGQVWVR